MIARAPGRVNLIGEHTDYNDGFVLPMGLPFETVVDATQRSDDRVCLRSEGYGETDFRLDSTPDQVEPWARYVLGMLRLLTEEGRAIPGFDAAITTTIPVGASLSSSAALEVASGFAMSALADVVPDPVHIAKLGQRVENEIIGIQSGIMDQLISAVAIEGGPTLIDCRTLATTATKLPVDSQIVIMDTMTRRELADSEYDNRRASCERVASAVGVEALRDASIEDLANITDAVDRRRATHVITENERVLRSVDALEAGDAALFGELMCESHTSLSADYEVSSEALDLMADIAASQENCFGARMTGGGFAGCAVALVQRDSVDGFIAAVSGAYEAQTGEHPDLWAVAPSQGATVEAAT